MSVGSHVFPLPQQKVPPEEWQANRFAVALLVNGELLRIEFEKRLGPPPIVCSSSDMRQQARRLVRELHRDLLPLHEIFGLSIEAAAIALETRGYVTDQSPML